MALKPIIPDEIHGRSCADEPASGDSGASATRRPAEVIDIFEFISNSPDFSERFPQLAQRMNGLYAGVPEVCRAREAVEREMTEGDRLAQTALRAFFEAVAENPEDPELRAVMQALLGSSQPRR